MNVTNNEYRDVTLVYGGGAYSMTSSLVSGGRLQLVGAAANTAQLLVQLGFLGNPISRPQTPPAVERSKPIEKIIEKTTIKGDFVSPYDGKE
jgi:hypothetical protein